MDNTLLLKQFFNSLKTTDKKTILKEGDSILSYLNSLSSNLKANGVLNRVLEIKWNSKNQSLRDKAIIQVAKEYISYLLKELKANKNEKAIIESLKTSIADLFSVLKRIDINLSESFILGSTNTQLTSIQFKHLEELFYTNSLSSDLNRYEIDHIVVPFLRTILESKIKKVLGIDIVRESNGESVDISKILEILFDLNNVELNKAFNLQTLKLIMKWLNHFMHRNLRPEPYILFAVLNYLKPIFTPGERKSGTYTILSVNISAYVEDLENFHAEIEKKLKKKYPECYITWTTKEVSSLKTKRNTNILVE